jgi:hypothetical protein
MQMANDRPGRRTRCASGFERAVLPTKASIIPFTRADSDEQGQTSWASMLSFLCLSESQSLVVGHGVLKDCRADEGSLIRHSWYVCMGLWTQEAMHLASGGNQGIRLRIQDAYKQMRWCCVQCCVKDQAS